MRLSVVVISFNPPAVLYRCLEALEPQIRPGESELLVVGRWPEAERAALQPRFPTATFLPAPAEENIPHMRLRGLEHSQGQLVALLEDDCVVGAGWCAAVLDAHEATEAPAVGGAIDPDNYPGPLHWAVYFCEYARFMGPFAGPVAALPGNNVSYKRPALPAASTMPDGFHEVFLHEQWRRAGRTLLADPRLAVRNINRWRWANVTRIPYHHGRAFAALRVERQPVWRRWFYAAFTPALPALQVGRIIREVIKRRRHLSRLCLSLPWMVLFLSSWAWGEAAGYLRGAGDSKAQWR